VLKVTRYHFGARSGMTNYKSLHLQSSFAPTGIIFLHHFECKVLS